MNRTRRPARGTAGRREPKRAPAPKTAPRVVTPVENLPPLRLGFVRGVAPSKWAERWARSVPEQPLELVPLSVAEVENGRANTDVLLERVSPGSTPVGYDTPTRTRHAFRLYEEAVALVLPRDHELADREEVQLDDLALVTLLSHPDHASDWPATEPWKDPSWAPANAEATLELVSTGLGGALMSMPMARHMVNKRAHAVVRVSDRGESLLPGTEIWATWAVERDANDIQRLIGVLRGRTPRSSR